MKNRVIPSAFSTRKPASGAAVFCALLLAPLISPAAEWRSALYPADWQPPLATTNFLTDKILQDFSYAGYHHGEIPVTSPAGPIFNVTDVAYGADPTGAQDSTTAIQTAINAAQTANGGVVYLPAGTYRVAPPSGSDFALNISASNIVLRGAGVGKTKLLNTTPNMRGKSIVLVQSPAPLNWRMPSGPGSLLTANLSGPATLLPVADASIFHVHDWVSVHCDATDAWATEQSENEWLNQGATLGGLAYLRQVEAVDTIANTVTIDIPTRFALKTRDNARVEPVTTPLVEVGLEGFSIANVQSPITGGWGENDYSDPTAGAYECHSAYAIRFNGVADSWMRDVASYQPAGNSTTAHLLSNGVRLTFCRTMTLQNCSFQRPQYGGGGGNGYLYRLDDSCDNLVQDCTATFTRHGFIFAEMGASGNVLYRCTDSQTARYTGSTGSVVADGQGSEHHTHFSHSNLVDSCTADSSFFLAVYRPFGTDPKHDLTAAHSVFWNTRGTGDPTWTGAEGSYVVASQQSRFGYVIGTSGTRNEVRTSVYFHSVNSAPKTNPVDFVEGVGEGSTLTPSSLYEDQVLKRLGHEVFRISAGGDQTLTLPTTQVSLSAAVTSGPVASHVAGAATYVWSVVSAPSSAVFSSTTTAATTITLGGAGVYTFSVRGTWNGMDSTDTVIVNLRSSNPVTHTEDAFSTKDATIRGGSYADTNFGNDGTLQLKKADQTDLEREVLLQFAPGAVNASSLSRAEIVLTPTSSVGTYSAEALDIPDITWNEGLVTWNNQPATEATASSWQATDGSPLSIDVTSVVQTALMAGAGSLSFKLRLTGQVDPNAVVSIRSKEGSRATGPILRMTLLGAGPNPVASSLAVSIKTRSASLRGKKRAKIRGDVVSSAGVKSVTITTKKLSVTARITAGTRWEASVPLKHGNNTLVARAVDLTGASAQTSRRIRAL